MTDIIIIGAGGHGAEIDEYIIQAKKITGIQEYNVRGFLDDDPENYSRYKLSAPLIGGVKDHKPLSGYKYLMAIANLTFRRVFVDTFLEAGAEFISLIHPASYVSPSSIIGTGVIIAPNVNVGPNVKIGNFTLVNSRSSLGHDTIIGQCNFIGPNVCFSGFSEVGNDNLFGINSATIPGIRVGSRNKIAAGMILDQNVGDDSVVFYRYKEKVIAVPNLGRKEA